MDENITLDVKNLNIYFKTASGEDLQAVRDLTFQVHSGELLGIVGESGCGKSVSSLAILGLLEFPGHMKADHIKLMGEDISRKSREELRAMQGKDMAMIFQEPMTSLNPLFTIGHQISDTIELHQKCTKQQAKERAIEMLRRVGIPRPEAVYKDYPNALSGGMRQRVMIAMALANSPKLLIADEPTTALDVTIQAQILELMRDLIEGSNTAIMFITHDLGVVAEMADRVLVMYAGSVVEQADVMTLFHDCRHPYTQGLLNSTIRVHEVNDELICIEGVVPSLKDMPSGCAFHPRCPYAQEDCKSQCPPLCELEPGHLVACLHPLSPTADRLPELGR